jgi:hypothetical protein
MHCAFHILVTCCGLKGLEIIEWFLEDQALSASYNLAPHTPTPSSSPVSKLDRQRWHEKGMGWVRSKMMRRRERRSSINYSVLSERDHPARLDQPESASIAKILVRPSIDLCLKFEILIFKFLNKFKVLSLSEYKMHLILQFLWVCLCTSRPLTPQTGLQKCGNHTFHV